MEIPEEDVPEPDSGFLNSISELGRRAKRGWFDNLLGDSDDTDTTAGFLNSWNLFGGGQVSFTPTSIFDGIVSDNVKFYVTCKVARCPVLYRIFRILRLEVLSCFNSIRDAFFFHI